LQSVINSDKTQYLFQTQTINNQIKATFKSYVDANGNPLDGSQITLSDGSLLKNITWDASGKALNATLQSVDGNIYTFTNKAVTSIKLPSGSTFQNITWDAQGKQSSATLTDPTNNQFNYVGGILSTIKLSDGTLLQNIGLDSAGKVQMEY